MRRGEPTGRLDGKAEGSDGSASRSGAAALRVLAVAAALLALVILVGTAIGFATGSRQRKLEREAASAEVAAAAKGRAAFTGIGTIRAKSADARPAVVVATLAFPYDSSDVPFTEEIQRKAPVLRAAALACLEARRAEQLGPAYEAGLKAALRDAFNARLSLGKVEEVWLSDFAVIQ
jgi:flagellar basal body-associated protein FliL